MTIESALTYFLAIFVFAVTPGPGIFALLAKGCRRGRVRVSRWRWG